MFRICRGIVRPFHSTQIGRFSSPCIQYEKKAGDIGHMILSRHAGKNAFSKQMLTEFREMVEDISTDGSVRCLIISSNVPKVFCAGADLKERLEMADSDVAGFVSELRSSIDLVSKIPVPTIAAIEGVALGGGLELALACDMRIAGSDATLGLTETALAIIPGAGGSQRLPRLIGVSKAKELIFTAARLSASEAKEWGIVNHVVDSGKALHKADEIANKIIDKGPIGIRMAKKAIDFGFEVDLKTGLEIEKICYGELVYTEDRKEGLKAFTEKRKPNYVGR